MNKTRSRYRQNHSDRRKHNITHKALFIDSDGILTRADRRKQPDRRLLNVAANTIVLEHIEI